MTDKLIFSRRDGMKGLLAISAVGALAACKQRGESSPKISAANDLKYASEGKFLNTKELAFITAFGNVIIPKTETPSAGEAGIDASLQQLISDWADDNFKLYWREGLRELSGTFNKSAGRDFMNLPALQRNNVLTKYDNDVFTGRTENKFYRDIKQTIATAYYMSELGATEELHYEPVPGEWRGDVPFSEIGKAWAT